MHVKVKPHSIKYTLEIIKFMSSIRRRFNTLQYIGALNGFLIILLTRGSLSSMFHHTQVLLYTYCMYVVYTAIY